jgi:hypothetical protein
MYDDKNLDDPAYTPDPDELAEEIAQEQQSDTEDDVADVEGTNIETPPRDSDADDIDMDSDEPGGNQQLHDTR